METVLRIWLHRCCAVLLLLMATLLMSCHGSPKAAKPSHDPEALIGRSKAEGRQMMESWGYQCLDVENGSFVAMILSESEPATHETVENISFVNCNKSTGYLVTCYQSVGLVYDSEGVVREVLLNSHCTGP